MVSLKYPIQWIFRLCDLSITVDILSMGNLFKYSFRMGRAPKGPRDSYGAWLQYLRRNKKLSQEEMALKMCEKLGINPDLYAGMRSSICSWERRGNLAGRDTIPALAEILGVSIEVLLRLKRTKDNRYINHDTPFDAPGPKIYKKRVKKINSILSSNGNNQNP
jgi:transcriptional regulator with XRE-family HTH domain